MLYHIENEQLFCAVDSQGAQLHSVKCRGQKTEYLWQGDPAVWYGQAPILFPFVGQLHGGQFTYDGVSYNCPKHGFARNSAFELLEHKQNRISFLLKSNENTRAVYPFDFALTVTFKLIENTLHVRADAENAGGGEMFFSIGAHPGFNCAMGDILRFEAIENLQSEYIDAKSLLVGDTYPVPLQDGTDLLLHPHLFDHDALILKDLRSKHVTLVRNGRNALRMDFGNAPVLGIWAKPNAPYVCIEPWFGINDGQTLNADLRQKRGILRLGAGEAFAQNWSVKIF
ncbi:MAG: aldose 1-epimerase family protein [Oscillospiraceae bacterium]|jgi:galactose mutarotase-like enzyme|nr:aldose 1-epimerase family protein [Oscillospiraceae bacterium]